VDNAILWTITYTQLIYNSSVNIIIPIQIILVGTYVKIEYSTIQIDGLDKHRT